MRYPVVLPNQRYKGKKYGEWLAGCCSWLFSRDIDDQRNARVFFLKNSSNYSQKGPHCKLGKQKVEVYHDQAIFVPVIIAIADSHHFPHLYSDDLRSADVNYDIDHGDDPPSGWQATIDGQPIVANLTKFRVQSPEFPLHVSQKTAIGGELEVPMTSHGTWEAVAAGYCILLKPLRPRDKPYRLHIRSRGRDDYLTEAFYDITVLTRPSQPKQVRQKKKTDVWQEMHEKALHTLTRMKNNEEIDIDGYDEWKKILETELHNLIK